MKIYKKFCSLAKDIVNFPRVVLFVLLLTFLSDANYSYSFAPLTGPNPKWFHHHGLKTDYDSMLGIAQNHSDSEVRTRAIEFLYYRFKENPKTADAFLKIAASKTEFRLRVQAGISLAYLKDKRATSVLKDLVEEAGEIKVQLEIGKALINLENFSGIKFLLKANESKIPEVRIHSSEITKYFFKYRKTIFEQFQVDILEEFLRFSQDSEPAVRMELLIFWPGNYPDTLLWPIGGIPERLQREYVFAVEKMASDDPDLAIREKAKRKLKKLQSEVK